MMNLHRVQTRNLTWWRRIGLVGLIAAFGPTHAAADYCEVVERETGERAAELIRAAGEVVFNNWARPVRVESVEWVRRRVVVNGELKLDLAYTYIPGDSGEYRSLGWLVDCGLREVAKSIPRSAFARAEVTDRSWSPPRLIGFLEMPSLFEWPWQGVPRPATEAPVPIYREPRAGEVLRQLRDAKEVRSKEYGYERAGALVLARRDDWFRIELADGQAGWVSPEHAGAFFPMEELIIESLSYLRPAWDGFLFERPERASAARKMSPAWRKHLGEEIAIEAKSAKWMYEHLWLEVSILSGNVCGEEEHPPVLATGWAPAHDAAGEPVVWFYSRGC